MVNLTEAAEEGLEAAAAAKAKAPTTTPDLGCSFRFLLAEGSRLQLGVETNAGAYKKNVPPPLFEIPDCTGPEINVCKMR